MKPTLITGASGFLGWHIARRALDSGHHVRALVRPGGRVKELEVQCFTGDLRDPDSLAKAVEGCGTVFHAAADYRLWAPNDREMYRSNFEGTRNLLEAARRARVDRFVYTSTVGCIGMAEGKEGDENTPVALEDMAGPYKRSKFMAEQVALQYSREGFPVVIANPTAPMGDHDWKPTPTGRIVVDFLKGDMPAYIDMGLNVVDAQDVAIGHFLALEKGRAGDRYILGSENLTLAGIFQLLERISGRKAPKVRIPYMVAYAAGVATTAWASVTGTPPRAPLDAVRMARKKMWVTNRKARQELGFQPAPAEVALKKAVAWFESNGYVS